MTLTRSHTLAPTHAHIHAHSHPLAHILTLALAATLAQKILEPLLHDSGLVEVADEENQGLTEEETNCRISAIIHFAFYANIFLFCAKCFASYRSLSLSVIASTLDSLLDLLSGSIIFIAAYIVDKNKDSKYAFPAGTSRIEPLVGIPLFLTLPLTLSLSLSPSHTLFTRPS